MGRLTEKEVIEGFKIDNALLGENESGIVERNNIAIKCIEELQEYRSICDSTEKLKLIDGWYSELCKENGQLKRELAEYKKLEEEGLILRLPCKVGATVWDIDFGVPNAYKITGFSFGTADDYIDEPIKTDELVCYYANPLGSITGSFTISEFGKTVFLHEEEAEQALERMKEGR